LRPIVYREKDNKNTGIVAKKIIVKPKLRQNQIFGKRYESELNEDESKDLVKKR